MKEVACMALRNEVESVLELDNLKSNIYTSTRYLGGNKQNLCHGTET